MSKTVQTELLTKEFDFDGFSKDCDALYEKYDLKHLVVCTTVDKDDETRTQVVFTTGDETRNLTCVAMLFGTLQQQHTDALAKACDTGRKNAKRKY